MTAGAVLWAGCAMAHAQKAVAVAKLDRAAMMQTWHEVARYPNRREKQCSANEQVLYALGDKKNSFNVVTECLIKPGEHNWWDDTGKLDDEGSGRLGIRFWLIFHHKYWVLAQEPEWMIVGTPNHKSLWLLSHTRTPSPETVDAMKAKAVSQGFNLKKLVTIPQQN